MTSEQARAARDGDGSFNANRYGPSRKKTARTVQRARRKRRTCLMCSKEFTSDGPGNRICEQCKETDAYQYATDVEGFMSEHSVDGNKVKQRGR